MRLAHNRFAAGFFAYRRDVGRCSYLPCPCATWPGRFVVLYSQRSRIRARSSDNAAIGRDGADSLPRTSPFIDLTEYPEKEDL